MDFWQVHDFAFLFCAAFFPRISMLWVIFAPLGLLFGPRGLLISFLAWGFLRWLGWLFMPHLLVAILATTYYWSTNPVLCVIAWIFAFAGTSAELQAVARINTR